MGELGSKKWLGGSEERKAFHVRKGSSRDLSQLAKSRTSTRGDAIVSSCGATAGYERGMNHGVREKFPLKLPQELIPVSFHGFVHASFTLTMSRRSNSMQEISRTGACFLFWSFNIAGASGGGPLSTWLSQRFHAKLIISSSSKISIGMAVGPRCFDIV